MDLMSWLLHHRPGGPDPGPLDRDLLEPVETILVALHGYVTSLTLEPGLREQVQGAHLQQMTGAIEKLRAH